MLDINHYGMHTSALLPIHKIMEQRQPMSMSPTGTGTADEYIVWFPLNTTYDERALGRIALKPNTSVVLCRGS